MAPKKRGFYAEEVKLHVPKVSRKRIELTFFLSEKNARKLSSLIGRSFPETKKKKKK
jgi:hypothetical protein